MVTEQKALVRECDYITLLLEDIEDIMENIEFLSQEEQEELHQQKIRLKLRMININIELMFIKSRETAY